MGGVILLNNHSIKQQTKLLQKLSDNIMLELRSGFRIGKIKTEEHSLGDYIIEYFKK